MNRKEPSSPSAYDNEIADNLIPGSLERSKSYHQDPLNWLAARRPPAPESGPATALATARKPHASAGAPSAR
jgi:hypothetical protein